VIAQLLSLFPCSDALPLFNWLCCVVVVPQLPPQRLWLNRYFCMPLLLLACAAAATAFMHMLSLLHN
jgi:hypothetical protein